MLSLKNSFVFNQLKFLAPLALGLFALPCTAEIYKYKDADGNWQFTDQTPVAAAQVEMVQQIDSFDDSVTKDLRTALGDKFKPNTPIEQATIAVVKIETPLGSGSGFFVSETGYLVTNKHVVRPLKMSNDEVEKQFELAKRQLAQEKKNLAYQRQRLKSMKADLDRFGEYVDGLWSSDEAREQKKEYNRRKKTYLEYKKEVDKYARWIRDHSREYTDQRNSYNRKYANASVAKRFKIFLKDDTELQASLVSLSNTHDLALLKLEDHIVPHMELAEANRVRQGVKVFAVGSPLGMNDYVTSGVVTSLKTNRVITDAQILPGNSGGPLVDEKGYVLGVNTQKMMSTRSIGSDGFGIAIPVQVIQQEFPEAINHKLEVAQEEVVEQEQVRVVSSDAGSSDLMQAILEDYNQGR